MRRLRIVNNGLLDAPIWNENRRARNWAAVVDIDGTAPGGLSRRFLPYGRGPVFYLVEQVVLFDVIEFAADHVAYSGNKYPSRWYGVVVARTDDFLDLEEAEDGGAAVLLAKTRRASKGDLLMALRVEKEHLESKAAAVALEIAKAEESKES